MISSQNVKQRHSPLADVTWALAGIGGLTKIQLMQLKNNINQHVPYMLKLRCCYTQNILLQHQTLVAKTRLPITYSPTLVDLLFVIETGDIIKLTFIFSLLILEYIIPRCQQFSLLSFIIINSRKVRVGTVKSLDIAQHTMVLVITYM